MAGVSLGRGGGGLSPRVRGNPYVQLGLRPDRGSIPACAGEPETAVAAAGRGAVYPRVCGGTCRISAAATDMRGLSPRVRGNRGVALPCPGAEGSIPACAGEPRPGRRRQQRRWVYPRVCGGTCTATRGHTGRNGLSPRVRGNRRGRRGSAGAEGSIPACAGEPPRPCTAPALPLVYPRVCGGTGHAWQGQKGQKGLSPRVRGNRRRGRGREGRQRSIPACAGEPTALPRGRRGRRVYPRVCGGTGVSHATLMRDEGLSPRVRGNPQRCPSALCPSGSIPACAGEPTIEDYYDDDDEVYPRVCGGTPTPSGTRCGNRGLSPRVRGNHRSRDAYPDAGRSIPACAGEPPVGNGNLRSLWVYPRVCGGTLPFTRIARQRSGLSPRVRGNQRGLRLHRRQPGSIPACAGEPVIRIHRILLHRVYPRVCGGTHSKSLCCRPRSGLSPRVRGNPRGARRRRRYRGSIPACAGEPPGWTWAKSGPGVYPRVCGGTSRQSARKCRNWGLSPRVRGNPKTGGTARPAARSIPACAGEPASWARRATS